MPAQVLTGQGIQPVTLADPFLYNDVAELASDSARVSADGRWVVFVSRATNIAQEPTGPVRNVFLHDRITGTTVLVSHAADDLFMAANGDSDSPRISAYGRFVVFKSKATNLVPGQVDTVDTLDVFLFDRTNRLVTLIRPSHDSSSPPPPAGDMVRISGNGQYIVFGSPNCGRSHSQPRNCDPVQLLYLYEISSGVVRLITHIPDNPAIAVDESSFLPVISHDGQTVVFKSYATNLVDGFVDSNGYYLNLYLYDARQRRTILVNRRLGSPSTPATGRITDYCLSQDGSTLALVGSSQELVESEGGHIGGDLFLFDCMTEQISLVSRGTSSSASLADGFSYWPNLSADGRFVVFTSTAADLIDGFEEGKSAATITQTGEKSNRGNVFLYDRAAETMSLVNHATSSSTMAGDGYAELASISRSGDIVVFLSTAQNLVDGFRDRNSSASADLFLYDRGSEEVSLVSSHNATVTTASRGIREYDIDASGTVIVFVSQASEFCRKCNDMNRQRDVFVLDRSTETINLVSRRAFTLPSVVVNEGYSNYNSGNQSSIAAITSAGRHVAFTSVAPNIVPEQRSWTYTRNLYMLDRETGVRSLISHLPGRPNVTANGPSVDPAISADSRFIAYSSNATNLVENQVDYYPTPEHKATEDIFLYDRQLRSTMLVSHTWDSLTTTAGAGYGAAFNAYNPMISDDGRFVAFTSAAGNLVRSLTRPSRNVYLYDRESVKNVLVSHHWETAFRYGGGFLLDLSADGHGVVFSSANHEICAGQTGQGGYQVYLYSLETKSSILVSHGYQSPAEVGNGDSKWACIDCAGRFISYSSSSKNLVTDQELSNEENVFLFDSETGMNVLVSRLPESSLYSEGNASTPFISGNGSHVAYRVSVPQARDVFLYDRRSGESKLISHRADDPHTGSNGYSEVMGISDDGRFVLLQSNATDLVAGIERGSNRSKVYVHDTLLGETYLVSRRPGSEKVIDDGHSYPIAISNDGTVLFSSELGDLVPGDFNEHFDLFLFGDSVAADLSISLNHFQENDLELEVYNDGPSGATNIEVSIELQHGLRFLMTATEVWTCEAVPELVVCRSAALARALSKVLKIELSGAAGVTSLPMQIWVESATPDPIPDNNLTGYLQEPRRPSGRRSTS
jgi:hypothetical protein